MLNTLGLLKDSFSVRSVLIWYRYWAYLVRRSFLFTQCHRRTQLYDFRRLFEVREYTRTRSSTTAPNAMVTWLCIEGKGSKRSDKGARIVWKTRDLCIASVIRGYRMILESFGVPEIRDFWKWRVKSHRPTDYNDTIHRMVLENVLDVGTMINAVLGCTGALDSDI